MTKRGLAGSGRRVDRGRLARGSGSTRRRADQRGAVLVEMAFGIPLMIALIFASVDFGAVFNSYLELRSASREGARLSTVDNGCFPNAPTISSCGLTAAAQLSDLRTQIRARATGLGDSSNMTVKICYTPNPRVGTDNVTITLSYPARSLSGIYAPLFAGITLRSTAVMRLEQLPTFDKDLSC